MVTKLVDAKGRVALGKDFANSTVIVERVSPSELRIIKAGVIPEDEAWLWDDEKALGQVRRGLQQATDDEFSAIPPDLDLDDKLSSELGD